MYSLTGQTEDQQVSYQHCPPRVLIFEISQLIMTVKRLSLFSPNNYVMEHNGAILYQLYLHLGDYRILRKKLVTIWDVLNIVMCFCISTLPVRQNNALNEAHLIYSLCANIQGHLKVSILT